MGAKSKYFQVGISLRCSPPLTCHQDVKTSHFGRDTRRLLGHFPLLLLEARFCATTLLPVAPPSLPKSGTRLASTSSCVFSLRITCASLGCFKKQTMRFEGKCQSSGVDDLVVTNSVDGKMDDP